MLSLWAMLWGVAIANECVVGDIKLFALYDNNTRLENLHVTDGSLLSVAEYRSLSSVLGNRFGMTLDEEKFYLPKLKFPNTMTNYLTYFICTNGNSYDNNGSYYYTLTQSVLKPQVKLGEGFMIANGSFVPYEEDQKIPQNLSNELISEDPKGIYLPIIPSLKTDGIVQEINYAFYLGNKGMESDEEHLCIVGEIVLLSIDAKKAEEQYGDRYLPTDGRVIDINDNIVLCAVIGDKYGYTGKGSNFQLPFVESTYKGTGYYICARGLFPHRV